MERNSLGSLPSPQSPTLGQGEVLQDQGNRQMPYLPADPGFLQEKLLDACPLDHPTGVEVDVNVLPEAA